MSEDLLAGLMPTAVFETLAWGREYRHWLGDSLLSAGLLTLRVWCMPVCQHDRTYDQYSVSDSRVSTTLVLGTVRIVEIVICTCIISCQKVLKQVIARKECH